MGLFNLFSSNCRNENNTPFQEQCVSTQIESQKTIKSISSFRWIDKSEYTKTLHFTPTQNIKKIYIGIPITAISHPTRKTYNIDKEEGISIVTKENGGCNIISEYSGIASILPNVCEGDSFMVIVDTESDILSIDISLAALEEYTMTMAGQNRRIEVNDAKKRIKSNKAKRDIKKQALQKLIDEGEVFPEVNKRPPITKEVADAVWNRDEGKCVYCASTEELHFDHIIPFSKGGDTSVENLQLLCSKCNLSKSNKIG